MKISALNIEAKIGNKREEKLARICNTMIERMIEYWRTDEKWREDFMSIGLRHWMNTDIVGLLDAMYYMDIIKDPVESYELFEAIRKEAETKIEEVA